MLRRHLVYPASRKFRSAGSPRIAPARPSVPPAIEQILPSQKGVPCRPGDTPSSATAPQLCSLLPPPFFFRLCPQQAESPWPGIQPTPQWPPEPLQWRHWMVNQLGAGEDLCAAFIATCACNCLSVSQNQQPVSQLPGCCLAHSRYSTETSGGSEEASKSSPLCPAHFQHQLPTGRPFLGLCQRVAALALPMPTPYPLLLHHAAFLKGVSQH